MTDSVNSEETPIAATNAPAPGSDESSETVQGADSATAAKQEPGDSSDVTEKVRSRFDELTRYRREAERDRDYWREMAMRNQEREAEPVKTPEPTQTQPKTLADFEYDEGKYQAHLFDQAAKRAEEAAERRLREQDEQAQANRRKESFIQREQDFSKDKPDYHEKTRDPRVPISQAMAEVMAESEEGPAVAYYLANNVALAAQIARLSPLAAAREIGRIEAKLSGERARAKEAAKKVSEAPPPTPKIEGAEHATDVTPDSPDSDKLPMDAWLKRREKQLSKRRK